MVPPLTEAASKVPGSSTVARAGGSPGSTASSVGPGTGGCLEKGSCDLGMQFIGPGLGKWCGLAFHPPDTGKFSLILVGGDS